MGRKKSKGTKARIINEEDSTDIIDERGYIDGVKVTRKTEPFVGGLIMLDSPQNQKKDSMDSWTSVARLPRDHRHHRPWKGHQVPLSTKEAGDAIEAWTGWIEGFGFGAGLVDPSLLHTWEKECRKKLGGEEKDQVDALGSSRVR